MEDFLTGITMGLKTEGQRNASHLLHLRLRNNLTKVFASGLDILEAFHQIIR